MKDDRINTEKKRCGNVLPPTRSAFYWPADKTVTHAQMRDVMALQ